MKILIVDDEELTRTGVIASVDWEQLGIDEVFQADDGVNGLNIAMEEKPEIILCDVRMPRMDGITMLERIEKLFPNTVVVFMSGYSDKEYLKAAIQLKAIDYIEKPIEQDELRATLRKAVERCNVIKLQTIADETHETTTESELAYRFTIPYKTNAEVVDSLCRELSERYNHEEFKYVTTYIVKTKDTPDDPQVVADINEALLGYLKRMNMRVIFTEKKSYNIIFHVYGGIYPQQDTIRLIAEQIGALIGQLGDYHIAVGDTVEGKENVYKSYSAAVILLQNSFFKAPGSIILKKDTVSQNGNSITLDRVRDLSSEYMNAIDEENKEKAVDALDKLSVLNGYSGTDILENQVKAIYHDMLLYLFKVRRKKNLVTDMSIENQETILYIIEKCFFFGQLQDVLKDKTEGFFEDIAGDVVDNPTIRLICEYIAVHYANPDLSVKSISDFAAMSTSYACTYFKNETGMTLNQYITDYRMKKAKQLLTNPRNKVNEISVAVGYSDGNYFAKSFRKYTGLSPSEYREQVIRS